MVAETVELGQTLLRWRKRRGLTQAELSQKSGLSQVFISLLENGNKQPSLETLEVLSKCLDVPVAVIVFQASSEEDMETKTGQAIYKELSSALKRLADAAFE